MAKKILIINGHPNPESFCSALFEAYQNGALAAGAEVKTIVIGALNFNPNLQFGYQKRQELEPDLLDALEKIRWAEHLVWVHPVWWGGFPAVMKGFIDRLFLPTIAFKYRPNSVWWDKLFIGKSARVIATLDQPVWYYWLQFGSPSIYQLKKSILEFVGIKPVKFTHFNIIKTANDAKRANWLKKAYVLGQNQQ